MFGRFMMRLAQVIFGVLGVVATIYGFVLLAQAFRDDSEDIAGVAIASVAAAALLIGAIFCLTAIAAYIGDRVSMIRHHQQRSMAMPAARPGAPAMAHQRPPIGQCPKCGSALTAQDRFCPNCGLTLQSGWGAPAPTSGPFA